MALPKLPLLGWAAVAAIAGVGALVVLAGAGIVKVSPGEARAFYGFPGAALDIPSGCTGVTVTSVSRPSFIGTNAASLAALNWILGFASGGSECFQWGQGTAELSAGTGGQVKNGLTFVASNYKEHVTYDISPDGGQVFIFDYWPADLGKSGSQPCVGGNVGSTCYDYQTASDGWIWVSSGIPLPACPANQNGRTASAEVILQRGGFGFGFGGAGEAFKLWCVAYVQVGATARLVGPGKRHEAVFSVSNGQQTLQMPLGVTDGQVGQTFQFPGASTAAASLKMVSISAAPSALDPNTAGLSGLYDLRGGKWGVISTSELNTNYLANSYSPTKARVDASNIMVRGSSVPDATDGLLTSMENANLVYFGVQPRKVVTAPGFTETTSGGASGGQLSYVGPRTFFVTQYQLLAAADWVGVYLPSGKPVVQSASPLDLGIGTTGTVQVGVKNDATVAASFNVDVTCSPSTVFAVNPPRLEPFGAGQTKTLSIQISKGTTTGAVSASCTYRACDSEQPSVCDSRAAAVTSLATGACVPGTQLPLASEIQECGTDGRYRTLLSCPQGVEIGATPGTYQCRTTAQGQTPPPPTGVPGTPPPLGPTTFRSAGPPWLLIAGIAAVAVTILGTAYFVTRNRRPPESGGAM